MPSYKGQSPQLSLRRYFADLIAIVSNRFTLCPSARHLAVYLLDLFMDRYDISIQQLHLVALSCLLLASKYESHLHDWKFPLFIIKIYVELSEISPNSIHSSLLVSESLC